MASVVEVGKGWRDQSACLDVDPEVFFPIGESSPAQFQIAAAQRVCNGCPVKETCLSWAMEAGEEYGVWGGLSESERRALRRRNARVRRAA